MTETRDVRYRDSVDERTVMSCAQIDPVCTHCGQDGLSAAGQYHVKAEQVGLVHLALERKIPYLLMSQLQL